MDKLERIEAWAKQIVDASIAVHRELGPGLLESTYEACLQFELCDRHLFVERQKPLPVVYRGVRIQCGYRIDLLVERAIILEIKAVEAIHPLHHAQMITYLKLSKCSLGFLMNFNVNLMKDGLKRIVFRHPSN